MESDPITGHWLPTKATMITQRKSKYKLKITLENHRNDNEIRTWCEESFGPGGRKHRWRFGWMQDKSTYYFRKSSDATMFVLRWAS